MIFLWILLHLPSQLSAYACEPSPESCDYYLCKEEEKRCGDNGYLLDFGYHLCEVYLKQERQSSLALQDWYPKVRLCLQKAVDKLDPEMSCATLKTNAFASHEDCYLQTGFCSLSWEDKFEVWKLAGAAAFSSESIEVSLKILAYCSL